MNMGLSSISASEVINNFDEKILKNIFKYLGEEKDASKIAKNISIKRSIKKIKTTEELVEIIKRVKNKALRKLMYAQKLFKLYVSLSIKLLNLYLVS